MNAFLTLSDELASFADEVAKHLVKRGHTVTQEPVDISFPEVPALSAVRGGITSYLIVVKTLDVALIEKWWAFGKSAGDPTKIVFVVAEQISNDTLAHARLRLCGVMTRGGGALHEVCQAADLTVNLVAPALDAESQELRELLAEPFERVANGDWKSGFEECCKCLEVKGREHFIDGVRTGRIRTQTPTGRDNTPTEAAIDEMTIGQLATRFSGTVVRTKKDDVLISCLQRINPARIAVAHAKKHREPQLRREVGGHIHAIFNTLKFIL